MFEATDKGGAFLALGTNLPHAGLAGADLLRAAVDALAAAGLTVRRGSSVWRTAPWPPAPQADFFNAALQVDAAGLDPEVLFERTCAVERAFGRERRARWDARTLDVDLVDFAGLVGQFGQVVLPHPRAHERAFVLAPMAELGWRHPVLGRTAAELLAQLPAGQQVEQTPEGVA